MEKKNAGFNNRISLICGSAIELDGGNWITDIV